MMKPGVFREPQPRVFDCKTASEILRGQILATETPENAARIFANIERELRRLKKKIPA